MNETGNAEVKHNDAMNDALIPFEESQRLSDEHYEQKEVDDESG